MIIALILALLVAVNATDRRQLQWEMAKLTPCSVESCRGGRCRFENCENPVSCRGGSCVFVNCREPSCSGGACKFIHSEKASCSGGGCDFVDPPLLLTTGFCTGGGCSIDNHPVSSNLEGGVSCKSRVCSFFLTIVPLIKLPSLRLQIRNRYELFAGCNLPCYYLWVA